MNRVALGGIIGLVAGGALTLLVPRVISRVRRTPPPPPAIDTPFASRTAREKLGISIAPDPHRLSLADVRELVLRGEYSLTDFDSRYRANLEKAQTLGIRMINGQPVPHGCYPEVVFVLPSTGGLCTGTVIAARAVLTAAHCFNGMSPESDIVIGDCQDSSNAHRMHGKVACTTLPCDAAVPDVAVITFDSNIPVAPRQLAAIDSADAASELLAIGVRRDNGGGVTKRMGYFTVASTCNGAVILQTPVADPLYYRCAPGADSVTGRGVTGAHVGGGDTGGPALMEVGRGDYR